MNIKVVDIKSRIISSASAVQRGKVDKDKIKKLESQIEDLKNEIANIKEVISRSSSGWE
jgi:septal ring factor EnvC (AmiA/AmiB activator)